MSWPEAIFGVSAVVCATCILGQILSHKFNSSQNHNNK
jgi:hypothetical protein